VKNSKIKNLTILSLLLTLAIIMGYLEAIFPVPMVIPGMKLGLCNLVIVIVLYQYGYCKAFVITVLRVLIVGLLLMNAAMIAYSLCGAILSLSGMWILKRWKCFSVIGISIGGGVLHNIAQIIVAIFLISNLLILYYLPILLVTGMITGAMIGVLSKSIMQRLDRINVKGIS